jgi:hypothetical protein
VEPPRPLGGPRLFCFSIVEPEGYEPDIIEAQLESGIGIFACDGQALLSTSEFWAGSKPGRRGVTEQQRRGIRTIIFRNADVGISKDHTAANTQLFVNAWESLQTRTAYSKYDWTIKVDPDAVLVPARLQKHLRRWAGRTGYVRNCTKYPDSDDFPMMFGSLEIFSTSALQAYFKGRKRCTKELPWEDWGEDFFMGRCLTLLKVEALDDFEVISDGVCKGVDCTDSNAAAFHPFKSKESWLECWRTTER